MNLAEVSCALWRLARSVLARYSPGLSGKSRLLSTVQFNAIAANSTTPTAVTKLQTALVWCMLLVVSGCIGKERACSVDGACPPNTVCVDKLCKNIPWWSDVSARIDAGADSTPCQNRDTTTPRVAAFLPRATPAGGWLGGRIVVHGGDTAAGGRCREMGRSTVQGGTWMPCTGWRGAAASTPSSRSGAASTVGLDSVWLLGGWQRAANAGLWIPKRDLWRYSSGTRAWTLVNAQLPGARHHAAMAVQSNPPSIWVHGGDAGTTRAGSVLLFDLRRYGLGTNTWKLPLYKGKPPAGRAEHSLIALSSGQQLLLFGGRSQAGLRNDTWIFDTSASTWTRLPTPAVAPSPRRGAALASSSKYIWLFGGQDRSAQQFRNDLWRMPVGAPGKWQRLRAGDLGKQAQIGGVLLPLADPCVPPDGFTTLDHDSPPRRSHALFTSGDSALWLLGGRGECGGLADIWRLDITTAKWRLRHNDRRGWSCPRTAESCSDWCTP